MKIRGQRECTDCDTRWSYYETGSVACPACGSLRSVGLDDRTEHTDLQTPFDLSPVRNEIEDAATTDVADAAKSRAREYVRRRGFVRGGALVDLDDTVLAAAELAHVADVVSRTRRISERQELYFLDLLRGADAGERPDPDDVPPSLRGARGLACADVVRDYRRDVGTWLGDRDVTAAERGALETLGDHVTRLRMLEGDVEPRRAELLVEATRDLATALRDGDEDALLRSRDRLDRLD